VPVGVGVDAQLALVDFELKRNDVVEPLPLGIDVPQHLILPEERERLSAPTALERARAVRDAVARLRATGTMPTGNGTAFRSRITSVVRSARKSSCSEPKAKRGSDQRSRENSHTGVATSSGGSHSYRGNRLVRSDTDAPASRQSTREDRLLDRVDRQVHRARTHRDDLGHAGLPDAGNTGGHGEMSGHAPLRGRLEASLSVVVNDLHLPRSGVRHPEQTATGP